MTDITNLKDAKALKRMGAPLNTPVVEREMSREGGKRYGDVWGALLKFCKTMLAYEARANNANYQKLRKAFMQIRRTAGRLERDIPSVEDGGEKFVHEMFLNEKVFPFIEGWDEIFEALDRGEPVQIQPMKEWGWSPLDARPNE
jgi:hypothetical protein